MESTVGSIITGIGLGFCLVIPIIWYWAGVVNRNIYEYYVGDMLSIFIVIFVFGIFLTATGVSLVIRAREKKEPLKEEPLKEKLPLPPPPTSEQNRGQYYCKACGYLFWRDEYSGIKVAHCPRCGTPDPIRIKMAEQVQTPPPPPPPEQVVKYWRSQFRCDACGHTFWIDEHRTKIPYCPRCGAPDPKVIGQLG